MNRESSSDDRSGENLLTALIGDGRSLLSLTGLALILSGGFMLFLSATGTFLPHDIDYLKMNAADLCGLAQCRIVHFMFHDRVSFGGVLIAIGTLYLWLVEFPLRRGEEWAWWVFAASGATGFASFLSYLGYGYLDTWHGTATLALFPLFLLGMWRTRRLLIAEPRLGWRSLRSPSRPFELRTRAGIGRALLLFSGLGMTLAGSVITAVGMTTVFVPEDLVYMGLTAAQIGEISSRLLPLIAHDRAGFGGGLLSCGVTVFLIVWKAPLTRALWQALLLSGIAGFACAIGIHYRIGYLIFTHLAPAWAGVVLYTAGMVFLWRRWPRG
ncbi:MAG TPA: hypothetical protein VN851_20980 [Thermoanaerobaculia bacterium]|nr:hypothetical protein [Thermoanaerobaculia bacterium]